MFIFFELMNVFLQSLFDVKIGLVFKMFFFFNFNWVLYLIYGNELKKKKYFSLKMYKRRNFFFGVGREDWRILS